MTEKHMYNLQCWQKRIEERNASGMTVKEWCDSNGFTKDAYYYWLSRLREEHYEEAADSLRYPPVPDQQFVEIARGVPGNPCQAPENHGVPMAVIRRGSLQIDIMPHATHDLLSNIFQAVGHV